jgi:hypothetical protein
MIFLEAGHHQKKNTKLNQTIKVSNKKKSGKNKYALKLNKKPPKIRHLDGL